MKDLLARLEKAIDGLTKPDDETETKTMTAEEFVTYAAAQIEKAASDTSEVRKARLAHLRENMAKVAKNFEGPTPGSTDLPMFKDPGQVTTTETEKPVAATKQAEASNFGANETPPAVAGAGSPPSGGEMPAPQSAPGSGFDSPATATFAKAMEALAKAVDALAKNEPPKSEEVKPVTKSVGVLWPADMNTKTAEEKPGAKTEDTDPEWGWDADQKGAGGASTVL